MANDRGEFSLSNEVTHPLRRTLIREIWAKQKTVISSRRLLANFKSGRIYSGGVSAERSCPQDSNGEVIFLIRPRVRELSWKYRKWPKIAKNGV